MAPSRSQDRRSDFAASPARRWFTLAGALLFPVAIIFSIAVLMVMGLVWLIPDPAEAIPAELQSVNLYGDAKTQVDDLNARAAGVQSEMDALDIELEQFSESYNQLQLKLNDVNTEMSALRRQLSAAQKDHAYRIQMFENRICDLYKSGGRGDALLELLLDSEGIEDLVNRVRLVTTLADQDQRIVSNLSESADKLKALLVAIDSGKQQQLAVRTQLNDQRDRIETALAERESAMAGIDTEIATVIESELQRQKEELERLRRARAAFLNGGEIYDGPLPENDAQTVDQFLQTATYYQGVPYVWAGYKVATGFDCSGFTQYVFAQHGISLPHYSGYQAQMGYPVSLDQIRPGDLLAFGFPVHHVGIYIGDGLFIHAPRTNDVVKISVLAERADLAAIRRFIVQPRYGDPAVW